MPGSWVLKANVSAIAKDLGKMLNHKDVRANVLSSFFLIFNFPYVSIDFLERWEGRGIER